MLDVTTTITINGRAGERFLSSLHGYHAHVPRALRFLAASARRSIEVARPDADLIAHFVANLIASGWISVAEPPLLFSPRVGDDVVLGRDVLAEVVRPQPGAAQSWRFLAAGTRARLVGWRERAHRETRAVLDLTGMPRRLVVFVGESKVTRAPWLEASARGR